MSYIAMPPTNEARARAVGMLEAGKSQKEVARAVGVSIRTIKRWWRQYRTTGGIQKKKSSGRPKILSRIQKIVIAKSVGKKRQSLRKLESKFKSRGYKGSKDTIARYMKKNLGMKPFRVQKVPKLTKKHISD